MISSLKNLFGELHTSVVARSMLFASLVGIVAGLGAVGFYYATNEAQHFFMSARAAVAAVAAQALV